MILIWLIGVNHGGIDISAPIGTNVLAILDGKVIKTLSMDPIYGNHIEIYHGKGITTSSSHLNKIFVTLDQNVNKGSVIGTVGNTGQSTGPHLHFVYKINGVEVAPSDTGFWQNMIILY